MLVYQNFASKYQKNDSFLTMNNKTEFMNLLLYY